ncbi:MAG: HDOD domain-containing protein [Acidobacteria bacterium]|nr:HDOD domain-containing protein [Acidobacteriota bacterium]
MINILFVDDEPNILEGLQRMLRSMRHEWKMFFAESGDRALELLQETKVDVIVSDMKMPGIDGARLLNEVREKFPQIIRIILSGYSEKEMIMKSVGTTHQYLSKPCDPEILKATVKRVCALRDLLADDGLRRLVSQMPTIPSLPTLYHELIDELSKNEPSTKKVGEIVKKDIGMTSKILQIVNSAFFGLQRRISDSNEAVEFLGLDTISSLTLGLGVISQLASAEPPAMLLARLWEHSIQVGLLASKIAQSERPAVAVDAFTAGLLHDIGEVVLAVNLPEQFLDAQKLVEERKIDRSEAEREVFETTHAEVGAYLLGLWGLPTQVVEAVAYHHTPSESKTEQFTALTAVHIANAIQNTQAGSQPVSERPHYDVDYLRRLNLLDRVLNWEDKLSMN